MKEAPYYCPICGLVLTCQGTQSIETKDKGEYRMILHQCAKEHYSSITRPKINMFSEMFRPDNISISIHYENGEYLNHSIRFYLDDKSAYIKEVKLLDEDFLAIFSRNNLHPLLERLEKYEVFL